MKRNARNVISQSKFRRADPESADVQLDQPRSMWTQKAYYQKVLAK